MEEGCKGHGNDRPEVHQRAEQLLQSHLHDPETPSASEVRKLAEQCEARRGELESQNEELWRVRRQLEHYRDRYVNLYDFAPLGYLTLDEDGYVQEVNLAGAKMLAVDRNDLIGHPLVDYVAEPDRPTFLDHVRRCSQGREEITSEITLQAKDGPAIVVQIHSIPVEEEDQEQEGYEEVAPQATFCKTAVTDITRRKQAEDQLRALNETLEQRVTERTSEAQQRASQLRALMLQLGQAEQQERRRLAQILQDRLQQLLIAGRLALSELEDHLRDAPLRKLVARVERLLEQSITESRQLTVELSPPVLYEAGLAAGLDWLARHMQRKHGLVVEVEADPQAEPSEESVRGFLFEAVRELLANVVGHAETDRARVTMERASDSEVRIEVVDEGAGFELEDLKEREATVGGVFGLFSIRERLEVLGGRLEINSAPNKGTRMVMLAPLRQQPLPELRAPAVAPLREAEAVAEVEPEVEKASVNATRVLLADDHAVIRHGLAELLERQAGIAVVGEAADGEEAVALAHKTRPHVILMDAVMPRLNGVEATRQIKARWPETRIIALSMYDEGEMPAAMYDAGVTLYLSKTVAPELLVAAVLEQGEYARQSQVGSVEGQNSQGA